MRNSALLKWAQSMNNKTGKENKNWIHPPENLQRGHIVYIVKFMGSIAVDQPKGFNVVREAVQKLRINRKLTEGSKLPKVELTISVNGISIQETKTKAILHQYPLYLISYCADDKIERQFISFIVKEHDVEQHTCFVFISDKLSEQITMTIGQAFELAYKRFLDMEVQRRLLMLNQRVKTLENENSVLRQRLKDITSGQEDVESYMKRNNIADILEVNSETSSKNNSESEITTTVNGTTNLVTFSTNSSTSSLNNGSSHTSVPPVPPRPASNSNGQHNTEQPAVGKRLEGLLMDDNDDLDDDFDPRAYEQSTNAEPKTPINSSLITPPSSSSSAGSGLTPPILAPPPKAGRDSNRRNYTNTSARAGVEDVFGSTINAATPRPKPQDPFGMGSFSLATNGNSNSSSDFQSAIGILDKKIMEMKDGFSRGLSISTEDFSLESLDPLKK